jgi:hypothetical protein
VSLFGKKPEKPVKPKKYYAIKVSVIENGAVIYSKTTPIAETESRLSGIQMLEQEVKLIWKNLLWAFHTVHDIENSK